MFGFGNGRRYDPLEDVIETLEKCLDTPKEIRGNKVYCTDWDIEITPEVEKSDERSAVLNFYLNSPDWDEPLFECCASIGPDQKTAVGSAIGSFLFAFMDGIAAMENNLDPIAVESEFAGKPHKWNVYRSNIVGQGDKVTPDFEQYWDALKDGIIKRLGNQRMCYVKVYACKAIGADGSENITGECRVNDVPSEELSAIVYDIAAKFDVQNFCSQKMFFFIKQDSQTLLPYPYRMNKLPALREKVTAALELFWKCETEEQYDALLGEMAAALQDGTLAEECFGFLPEICAERAFPEVRYSEQVQFAIGDSKPVTAYKSQIADFYPLGNLMFGIFDSGHFGEKTNDLFKKLIGYSATAHGISQCMSECMSDGKTLDHVKMTALLFNVSPKFELR